MYERRDAAFREWEPKQLELWSNTNLSKTTVAKEGFNAGWQAHKDHVILMNYTEK